MLQIEVNEADSRLFKDADAGLVRLPAMADSVALEATVDSTAESFSLTQRRITSTISSSGNCSDVRSSQTSVTSMADRLVVSFFGRWQWSPTVVRPRQRRIVVSLTPSSAASSATGFLLRWM